MNTKAINEFGFCRIWRIKQISEGVIHLGQTPSSIWLILHILQKPNSLIAKNWFIHISIFKLSNCFKEDDSADENVNRCIQMLTGTFKPVPNNLVV